MVQWVDDGIGIVGVVGGHGCRWGVGIEQRHGHGYGAQAGARGVGVWARTSATRETGGELLSRTCPMVCLGKGVCGTHQHGRGIRGWGRQELKKKTKKK